MATTQSSCRGQSNCLRCTGVSMVQYLLDGIRQSEKAKLIINKMGVPPGNGTRLCAITWGRFSFRSRPSASGRLPRGPFGQWSGGIVLQHDLQSPLTRRQILFTYQAKMAPATHLMRYRINAARKSHACFNFPQIYCIPIAYEKLLPLLINYW